LTLQIRRKVEGNTEEERRYDGPHTVQYHSNFRQLTVVPQQC
jgi:hypothetical protein